MLSYQHTYHAGNFADVHKHFVLTRLLAALQRKDKPFCYFETHAGRASYDLKSAEAVKTGEYETGILRLWNQPVPALMEPLLERVQALNTGDRLRFYPGSPLIARGWLRPQDRMQLMDLHPQEYEALKEVFRGDRQVGVHHRDGYEGVLALTPPPEKRGLVLIDPSYEVKEDYQNVPKLLEKLSQRWSTGIFAVWYPLLPAARHQGMLRTLARSGLRKILVSELRVGNPSDTGMYGTGMAILNTPWQLDAELGEAMPWLAARLAQDDGAGQEISWLVAD